MTTHTPNDAMAGLSGSGQQSDSSGDVRPVRRFGWRARVLAVLLSFVVAMMLAEVALRVLGVQKGGIIVMNDYWTGSSYIPNRELMNEREGRSLVRINSVGLHDHETTVAKPDGVFRIAFLGDSFIDARQVDLEEAVTEKLEKKLSEQGRYEVLNFGVNGFSTAQEYLRLREFAMPFEPDVVIFGLHTGNDIRDNHKSLSAYTRPFFHLTEDGGLEFDAGFRDFTGWRFALRNEDSKTWRAISWVTTHVRLAGVAIEALRHTLAKPRAPRADGGLAKYHPGIAGDWRIYDPNPTGEWAEAWTITERLLLRSRELCDAHGARFVVVAITNPPQVWDEARTYFAEHKPELDLDDPDRRLADFCGRNGIAFLTLVPEFLQHHRDSGDLMHGFGEQAGLGHWNQTGHRLAANRIARFLVEERLIPMAAP